mmetsp:Transcript_3203/g.4665  ORF Transcript_3203/g.4665 Transcript_3203/m.4665 type:complete len:282 (-) Transcript_3203:2-847(-)
MSDDHKTSTTDNDASPPTTPSTQRPLLCNIIQEENNKKEEISNNNNLKDDNTNPSSPLLHPFNLYGWTPDPTLSNDENYMDLVLIITRSSGRNIQGHVAALIVNPLLSPSHSNNDNNDNDNNFQKNYIQKFHAAIYGAAVNQSLFQTSDSDIHAEIACLSQACKNYNSTKDCTAYITIPPCKRCFAALVTFGITKIVSRQYPPKLIWDAAVKMHGMEVVAFDRDTNRAMMKRMNERFFQEGEVKKTDEELMEMVAQRKKWREAKKMAKQLKKRENEANGYR